MIDYIKIENSPDLLRDMSSKAIINNNRYALETAKANRKKRLDQEKRLQKVEEEVSKISSTLEQILEIVKNGNTNR